MKQLTYEQFLAELEETGEQVCAYCGNEIRSFRGCCGEIHYDNLYEHPLLKYGFTEHEFEDQYNSLLPLGNNQPILGK